MVSVAAMFLYFASDVFSCNDEAIWRVISLFLLCALCSVAKEMALAPQQLSEFMSSGVFSGLRLHLPLFEVQFAPFPVTGAVYLYPSIPSRDPEATSIKSRV